MAYSNNHPAHRRSAPGPVFRAALCLLLPALLVARPLRAQNDPRLIEAVRLAQDGQGDSARATVSRLLNALSPADSTYPEALYTMGLISRSVDEMRRNYQRISVEYATSSWADDALLRLGMLDYAAGNPTVTVRQMERIRVDYPDSPIMSSAAYWAARAYFDLNRPADACRWITDGLARVGDDIELANQLRFYSGRCAALAEQPAESTRTDTARSVPRDSTPKAHGFSVQVGAVKTDAAANALVAQLKSAGFEAHIAREAGLLKVRSGRYPDKATAQAAAARIKAKLGATPYVIQES